MSENEKFTENEQKNTEKKRRKRKTSKPIPEPKMIEPYSDRFGKLVVGVEAILGDEHQSKIDDVLKDVLEVISSHKKGNRVSFQKPDYPLHRTTAPATMISLEDETQQQVLPSAPLAPKNADRPAQQIRKTVC